jgi:hypothetical protein
MKPPTLKPPTLIDRLLAPLVSAVIIVTMPVIGYDDWPGRLLALVLGGAILATWNAIASRSRTKREFSEWWQGIDLAAKAFWPSSDFHNIADGEVYGFTYDQIKELCRLSFEEGAVRG